MWPFNKPKPPVYAAPKPKRVTFTVEDVSLLAIIVATWSDKHPIEAIEDAGIQELIYRCRHARDLTSNGHRVSIFIPFGDLPNNDVR